MKPDQGHDGLRSQSQAPPSITPQRMEGIVHTHSIPCVCMPVCLPKAIFKRSTKNLRQATAQLANWGALYKLQMMRIAARSPRLNLWRGGYSCKIAPSA